MSNPGEHAIGSWARYPGLGTLGTLTMSNLAEPGLGTLGTLTMINLAEPGLGTLA